ncbi:hypothetical protein BD410DRAFT_298161 [Rickenella mellea]|uniref:Aminoglycoside phosphotransferase domain-containing protein n=1 Tax=Rickenella mellea TaxID=50990 RepID=A0A4Y7PF35_9AGAM|nr:hypothetical protein BD410DRAFT_298161 [Rickenella mellea]
MTGLPGTEMFDRLQRMHNPEPELALLAKDLKGCFGQIRSLPPPTSGPRVSGYGGGKFRCESIDADPIGPFATERGFYQHLYEHAWTTQRECLWHIGQKVHSTPYKLCLTHNDLAPHNILLEKSDRHSGSSTGSAVRGCRSIGNISDLATYLRRSPSGYILWVRCSAEELAVGKVVWLYNDPW